MHDSDVAVTEGERSTSEPSIETGEATPPVIASNEGSSATLAATPDESPPPSEEPNPYVAPLVRHAGDLTVHAPPKQASELRGARLRSHIDGPLSAGRAREWVGPQVPGFVALAEGTMELFLLDRVGDEFLAFYRDPYGASSCTLMDDAICDYFVRLYDITGRELWARPLHDRLSVQRYVEIQDIRYADGTLYYNEACQSYSKTVKGNCSFLVAMEPISGEILWRTKPLVSNGMFLVHGDYIVTGYGFTAEKDFVYVVSRADGSIVQKVRLRTAAERFVLHEDGRLEVTVYPGTSRFFRMEDWDTAEPRLVEVTASGSE